ncbi:MAG: hypothetical protein K0U29_04255, partial [Gammaproteobacteria bacterium]|nr:hypothetical protein [Gammaproteobacteria bacterium]
MASKITSASYQLICALFALIVVVIIFLTIPRYHSHPNGVLLPTKKVHKAASPDLVIVYDAIPVSAQIVGQINIQQQYIANEQLAQRQMIQYAE